MSYVCNHNGVLIGYGSGPHRKLASWTMSHGVSHATVARLWDEDLLDALIAGRVLFVSGLLSGPKRFGEDDLYLPAPSAVLIWVQGAGVAAHLAFFEARPDPFVVHDDEWVVTSSEEENNNEFTGRLPVLFFLKDGSSLAGWD
ncbi:hypothetical protein FOZ63_004569, partial [Perkinsus olseni]